MYRTKLQCLPTESSWHTHAIALASAAVVDSMSRVAASRTPSRPHVGAVAWPRPREGSTHSDESDEFYEPPSRGVSGESATAAWGDELPSRGGSTASQSSPAGTTGPPLHVVSVTAPSRHRLGPLVSAERSASLLFPC